MLEIRRLTLREISLELKEPFRISSGETHVRRLILVEIADEHGNIGWGECPAGEFPHYSPETADTAWLAIGSWIAPLVLGHGFNDVHDLAGRLAGAFRGHRMAKAGVEMAVWELVARRRGISLSRLLGGTRNEIETGISIGIQTTPDQLAERAAAARSAGYRRVKAKIRPGADTTYLAAAREAIGRDMGLVADANSAYTLSDLDVLQHLDAFDLMMIEQPLACDDLVRHAELQRKIDTPICLDESIVSLDRAEDMVTLGSGKIINIKPARVGGLTEAMRIHDFAARHEIPVWCGGLLESGIGRAHNVALASLPNFTIPGDLSPSQRYWERDIVMPEWTMENGMITVPHDKPGMGVEVDLDFIDSLIVRQETLKA